MTKFDLERLFKEHAQALYGFLAYRVGDPTVAEDLLGDTFERIVRARRRFDKRKGSETAWIYTIALNCLRDHLRRTGAERKAYDRVEPGREHDMFGRIDDRDLLLRGLGRLEAGEREVMALRYGADLRLQDVACVTGLPITTVQGRLYSGLRKLRELLEPDRTASG
jgi:RNA polymerase sigma factor (sigma-70 family)